MNFSEHELSIKNENGVIMASIIAQLSADPGIDAPARDRRFPGKTTLRTSKSKSLIAKENIDVSKKRNKISLAPLKAHLNSKLATTFQKSS